jgi:hypothetical protein
MKPDDHLTTTVMNLQTGGVMTNVRTPLADGVHDIDGIPFVVLTVQRRMEQAMRNEIERER